MLKVILVAILFIPSLRYFLGMSSDDKPEIVERGAKKNENEEDEESTGFLGKLKGFVQDIGEKIEGTIGFGKPTAESLSSSMFSSYPQNQPQAMRSDRRCSRHKPKPHSNPSHRHQLLNRK